MAPYWLFFSSFGNIRNDQWHTTHLACAKPWSPFPGLQRRREEGRGGEERRAEEKKKRGKAQNTDPQFLPETEAGHIYETALAGVGGWFFPLKKQLTFWASGLGTQCSTHPSWARHQGCEYWCVLFQEHGMAGCLQALGGRSHPLLFAGEVGTWLGHSWYSHQSFIPLPQVSHHICVVPKIYVRVITSWNVLNSTTWSP